MLLRETGLKLGELLDGEALAAAIRDGHVHVQAHPTEPLAIFNYTNRCQFDRAWTDVTRTCRGLIVDTRTNEIVARPLEKFFNYGEHDEATLSLDEFVTITDKMDGSLGIMYRQPSDGRWAIATRGSFTSEQARHATAVYRERYADAFDFWASEAPEFTHLFEIVYPANRIVVDYGGADDLFYLGNVHIPTGDSWGPSRSRGNGWPGPQATVFEGHTLGDALSMEPRTGAEGIVVHYNRSNLRIKLKQADYVALHRILTQTSARTVWEYLAVNACKHLIEKPLHWGSRLELDPARAAEVIAVGSGWLDRLLDGVPDEFHAWLREQIDCLNGAVDALAAEITETADGLRAEYGTDRKALAAAVGRREHFGEIYLLIDGRDITTNLWLAVYPEPGKPFATQEEDVA
jgi:RNA ligase